jgi:hypothetical protein
MIEVDIPDGTEIHLEDQGDNILIKCVAERDGLRLFMDNKIPKRDALILAEKILKLCNQ